jgi:hypothetical protein
MAGKIANQGWGTCVSRFEAEYSTAVGVSIAVLADDSSSSRELR